MEVSCSVTFGTLYTVQIISSSYPVPVVNGIVCPTYILVIYGTNCFLVYVIIDEYNIRQLLLNLCHGIIIQPALEHCVLLFSHAPMVIMATVIPIVVINYLHNECF